MAPVQTYKFVDLSGYGFSGKSAVIDLLRELRGCHVPSSAFEFCLLRIQGGILDLEDALSRDWSPIRSDAAIRRFKRLVCRLGVKNRLWDPRTWFSGAGWNYDTYFAHQFLALSARYIDALVQASWITNWPYPLADLGDCELLVRKLGKHLGVRRAYDFRVYLSFPTDFASLTRVYLEDLLSTTAAPGDHVIVLHNAFEPFQPQRCLKFFSDARCIVVDRDPRDIYVQQRTYRPMAVGVRDFIQQYRTYREAAVKFSIADRRIMRIRFEDLVKDCEHMVGAILEHLGEDASVHAWPRRHFDPEASRRYIGLWRAFPSQDEIALIYRELRAYCD